MGTTKHASSAVKLSVVPILAAGFLTGCGDDEQTAYCVDENQQVIENRYCDDDDGFGGGGFFWFFVGSSVGRGYVAGDRITGVKGERIRASDKAALAKRGGFGATGRSNSSPGSVGRVSSRSGGG